MLAEKGEFPPLIICAEGGTSNGKQLIAFKKGCFVGLRAIQPTLLVYKSPFIDLESSVCSMYSHMILIATNPYCSMTMLEFPDFVPNEYFWKNHQREGEDKWKTYARCVRDIMAKEGGLGVSDLTIEDKFNYKKLLYPNKKGKHSD